jgi:anti-sigma regulatory factor (Ser/Thr protein kinase)
MSKIILPATIEHLENLVGFVSECARKTGFSNKRLKEIELASEESLVNIFNYAYPEKSGEVTVTCFSQKDTLLKIEIMDKGIPFDPLSLPEPDLHADLSERKVGGLGIFFIRQMVDEIQYRRKDGNNILTLTVFINKAV